MSNLAIKVENLSKRYRIGLVEERHDTFFGAISGWIKSPFKNYRRVKKLSSFSESAESEDIIWALKDVSFDVKKGEVLGIIGRNGAGKSTLLKILSRITEPTSGFAEIHGRISSLLEVGTGFHPELTGRENVYLNGTILGMTKSEIDRKFDEIVEFSGIEKFIETPVKRYSSGMRVRLAFSVAAHLEPEILLIDEVLAVGDAQFQRKCLGKMDTISKEGRTVLFVSHNMTAIESLCPKTIWIENGEIEEISDSSKVISNYLRTGAATGNIRKWDNSYDAPGNEIIKIHKVAIFPEDGNSEIKVDTPLILEFQFWNYEKNIKLNLSAHFYTIEGTPVFNSGSESMELNEGLYKYSCQIPGNFLNDETYRVQIMFVGDRSRSVFTHDEILIFEVNDIQRDGAWFGKWFGVVRPKLEWQSEKLE